MRTFQSLRPLRTLSVLVAVAGLMVTTGALDAQAQAPDANDPWYPSLQAFEHYDSGRSHVFSQAEFDGSFRGKNRVDQVRSADGAYPSGYNMSYLDRENAFIQGGSYGNLQNSIGP